MVIDQGAQNITLCAGDVRYSVVICIHVCVFILGAVHLNDGQFAESIKPVVAKNLECMGIEQRLIDCRIDNSFTSSCRNGNSDFEDAGIVCQGKYIVY